MRLATFFCACVALLFGTPAFALVATVDHSKQEMVVTQGGQVLAVWPVSTGRSPGMRITGTFKVQSMDADHVSSKYPRPNGGAPMPHAVFFHGNFAVHGTDAVDKLGRPASNGCIRLSRTNARQLYNLVLANGRKATFVLKR